MLVRVPDIYRRILYCHCASIPFGVYIKKRLYVKIKKRVRMSS